MKRQENEGRSYLGRILSHRHNDDTGAQMAQLET
jgi:hypothetical protein